MGESWPAARAEGRPRHSRDPQAHSPAAAAVARVHRTAWESHPPAPALLASRSGSRRLDEPQAAGTPRRFNEDWKNHTLELFPQAV
jgi:hypothetical protein